MERILGGHEVATGVGSSLAIEFIRVRGDQRDNSRTSNFSRDPAPAGVGLATAPRIFQSCHGGRELFFPDSPTM